MANPIFNDILGIDPRVISSVLGASKFLDALTDPIFGYLSDITRSKYGRRRPWIAVSAVLCSVSFASIWLFPRGMGESFYIGWFIATTLLSLLCLNTFSTPYSALGMELTPDYHERTSVMAYKAIMAKCGGFLVSSLYLIVNDDMFDDIAEGMRYTGIGLGIMIAIFTLITTFTAKEHPDLVANQKKQIRPKASFLQSLRKTLSNKPFLIIIATSLIMLAGMTLVLQFGYYIITYHVFHGVKGGSTGLILTLAGYSGQAGGLSSIPLIPSISKRFGKRKTLLAALCIAFFGTLIKLVCFTPENPYLVMVPGFTLAFAFGAIWTLLHSMVPDVIDLDELKNNERREGMFNAAQSGLVKTGVAIAAISSGFLLNFTGFDTNLGPEQATNTLLQLRIYDALIPAAVILIAFILMYFYPLTEERSYKIRTELEQRRKLK